MNDNNALQLCIVEQAKEIIRLRKALEFYAEYKNWCIDGHHSKIEEDHGNIARLMLKNNNITCGSHILLSCDVRPGPFSNERLVRISACNDWCGFVSDTMLLDEHDGKAFVSVKVVGNDPFDNSIRVLIPGESLNGGHSTRISLNGKCFKGKDMVLQDEK